MALSALPEELKLHVISYLDLEPPSLSWHTRQPASVFTDNVTKGLKSLSLVSKDWRRLVKPALFRCLCIRLAPQSTPQQHSWSAAYREALEANTAKFKSKLFRGKGFPSVEWPYRHSWQDLPSWKVNGWVSMIESATGLIPFLESIDSSAEVQSLTIISAEDLSDAHPDSVRDEMHCLIASATFWEALFGVIEPLQLTLLAPPSTLACLLNCSVRLQDAWAFPGMSLQLLSLRRPSARHDLGMHELPYNQDDPVQLKVDLNGSSRPALASVVYIRPWTDLVVSEGSYIQAYSTYEYFHKEPPGILYPIAQAFEQPMNIQSITYQAVFPFSHYLAAGINLMSTGTIRHLDVKVAPGKDDNALTDPQQVGKADIADCWNEVEQAYSYYTNTTGADVDHTHLVAHSRLETFSSGDCGVQSIGDLLRRSFEMLEWDEVEEGKWVITDVATERRRRIQGIDEEE